MKKKCKSKLTCMTSIQHYYNNEFVSSAQAYIPKTLLSMSQMAKSPLLKKSQLMDQRRQSMI